jgi:murein DD-endopeptidase MepM/ murein hydrolase activator NlpD
MAVIQFRSPVTTPLHRKGQCVPSSDDFCVTQQFDDPDYYWSNIPNPPNPLPTHRATDIGNFRCGYPIVAMAAGTAWRVQDNASALGAASNALGIVVDHGSGVKSAYWHLASWTAGNGAWVQAGEEIGKLGSTGLGATCHTHIEMTVNAVKVDPEPHMFGAPLDTSAPSEDDEPMYNPPDVLAIYGQGLVTRAGARLRENRGTSYPVLTEFPAGVQLTATARVIGEPVNGLLEWYETKAELAGVVRTGFIHSSAVDLAIAPPPSGFTQAQVDAARIEGTSIGFARAKVKAAAAVQAIEP